MSTKTSTLDDLGDLHAEPGTRPWAIAVRDEIAEALHQVEFNADHLKAMIRAMEERRGYRALGFMSFEDFCAAPAPKGLGRTKIELHIEIQQRAKAQAERAEKIGPLQPEGTAGPGRGNKTDDNYNLFSRQGTDPTYLTRRIARDRPDILQDMKAGKYRSVRAAAIDAGIIDPDKVRRYSLPTDPRAAGRYMARHVDLDWYDAFSEAFLAALEQQG